MPASPHLAAFPALHAVTTLAAKAEPHPRKKSQARAGRVDDESADAADSANLHNVNKPTVFDVKFYPYTHPDDEAVFAVVAGRDVYVCRPLLDPHHPLDILTVFRDPQPDASLNSLVWSQDPETGDPLLCFAGAGSGDVKVVNVVKQTFLRSLCGHGGAINDLAISPLSPNILASASVDFSIRIWNLDKRFQRQPCAALLASPDAHKQPTLALAFHASGKYILSSGTDTMINMWPVPDVPDHNAGTDKPTNVYFPLFSSTEVHSDYVDCMCWHGDLILSHAASHPNDDPRLRKSDILLWKIDGFSSAAPTPENPPLAAPGVFTRSAFGGRFQRLLTFDMTHTTTFYMRFSLFAGANHHPILVMGSVRSKFSFWDLQALEVGLPESPTAAGNRKPTRRRGGGRSRGGVRRATHADDGAGADEDFETAAEDDGSASSSDGGDDESPDGTPLKATAAAGKGSGPSSKRRAKSNMEKSLRARFDVTDPFRPVAPHHTVTVPKYNFAVRQVAWSNDGAWCVAACEMGILCIFRRGVQEAGAAADGEDGDLGGEGAAMDVDVGAGEATPVAAGA